MKRIQKAFALLLTLVLLCGLLPMAVFAADDDFIIEDKTLIKYTGKGGNITIPGDVRNIDEIVFRDNTWITGVTIGLNVEQIGSHAFCDCTSLKTASVAGGKIGYAAFSGCTDLTTVTLGEKVEALGGYTFSGCTKLTAITIPEGVTDVPTSCFYKNTALKEIRLPSTLKTIGERAFMAVAAESVYLPVGVKSIDDEAFALTENLKDIWLPETVTGIGHQAFTHTDDFRAVVHGVAGSYAETWFKENPHYVFVPDYYGAVDDPGGKPGDKPGDDPGDDPVDDPGDDPVGEPGMGNFRDVREYRKGMFSDVNDQWFAEDVAAAYRLGLVQGNGDGSFNVNGTVTLAEAVTMAARIHSMYHTGKADFVQGPVWYQVYVDYAREKGILTKTYSNYDRPATRAEYAEILSKALPASELPAINTVEDGAVPDVPMNASYAASLYMLYRAGILTGNDEKGTYYPDTYISRSEIAALITRMADPGRRKHITLTKGGNTGGLAGDNDQTCYEPRHWSWTRGGTEGYGRAQFTSGKYVRTDGRAVLYIESSTSPDFFAYQLFAMAEEAHQSHSYTPELYGPQAYASAENWSDSDAYDDCYMTYFSDNGDHTITVKTNYLDEDLYIVAGNPDGVYKLVREK